MGLAADLGAANRGSGVGNDSDRFPSSNDLAEEPAFDHSFGWDQLQRSMAGRKSRTGVIGSKFPVGKR
jgi:hypothetical protein